MNLKITNYGLSVAELRIAEGYVEAMLWANTTGEDFEPVDARGTVLPVELAAHVAEDVRNFLAEAEREAPNELCDMLEEGLLRMGHNLALSRNGHGAGFFDYGFRELQRIARQMGTEDWIREDGGRIYAV